MNAPQIIIIVLFAIGFGLSWQSHGEPKTGKENAWATLLGHALMISLLWWGGFFSG